MLYCFVIMLFPVLFCRTGKDLKAFPDNFCKLTEKHRNKRKNRKERDIDGEYVGFFALEVA